MADDEIRRFLEGDAPSAAAGRSTGGAPTKSCKECMAAIPAGAKRCMHCGVAQNRETSLGQVVGAIFIVLVVLWVLSAVVRSW